MTRKYHETLQRGCNEALYSNICPGNSPLPMKNATIIPRKWKSLSLADDYFRILQQFNNTVIDQPFLQSNLAD